MTTHQSVKQYIHLTTQPLKAVLVVNRTVDANTIKQTNQTRLMKQVIVSYRSISTSKLVTLQCLHS